MALPSHWQELRDGFSKVADDHSTRRLALLSGKVTGKEFVFVHGAAYPSAILRLNEDQIQRDWLCLFYDSRNRADRSISSAAQKFSDLAEDAAYALKELEYSSTINGVPHAGQFKGESLWFWTLFHIAWKTPKRSLLRASMDSSAGLLFKYKWALARQERGYVTEEEKELLLRQACESVTEHDFVAYLEHDPFTASVYLIDYLFDDFTPTKYMTKSDAARLFKVSVKTIGRWAKDPENAPYQVKEVNRTHVEVVIPE